VKGEQRQNWPLSSSGTALPGAAEQPLGDDLHSAKLMKLALKFNPAMNDSGD
jgi:hypothetical protein